MNSLYSIKGVVESGEKRGRLLGFPTANVLIKNLIPDGIYASTIEIDNKKYIAATFIGIAKTFTDSGYKLESYIIDFADDIYGKTVKVELFEKLRSNMKFSSEATLIQQMHKDVRQTKDFFKRNNHFFSELVTL